MKKLSIISLVLSLLVTGCIEVKMPETKKFAFKQRVIVTTGFNKGRTGSVVRDLGPCDWPFNSKHHYIVFMDKSVEGRPQEELQFRSDKLEAL